MRSVLVTHPGLQHAHQLALALHERELLQAFWSGVPIAAPGEPLPRWLPTQYRQRIRRVPIPVSLRLHPARFQIALRALATATKAGVKVDPHRVFHWFDAWAARRVLSTRPNVVVAYENSAYHTFAAAKAIGARCVLDAASFHHKTSSKLLPRTTAPYTIEVNRRKDAEVQMADLILTCSPLAADTYIENGVPAAKVRPLLLGAERPTETPSWEPHEGPLRFLFAGAISRLKSIDSIVAAFQRLHADGFDYELHFVGGVAENSLLKAIHETPHATHSPSIPQRDLFRIFSWADCLLLPSRFDSFGMVVAEAMACGTPAIVSTQTGSKALIETFPDSGWVIDLGVEPLYEMLVHFVMNPSLLSNARQAALDCSKQFSWEMYRRRAGHVFEDFLQ